MRHTAILAAVAITLASVAAVAVFPRLGRQDDGSFLVPTGQRLTPSGKHIEVDDRPLGMVLSPDGARLAVVTGSNFAPRALHIIDAKSGTLLKTERIGDSFVGVAFSADGKTLYVGGGASNEVKVLREDGPRGRIQDRRLRAQRPVSRVDRRCTWR